MEIFTSILLLPSSGSRTTTYFDWLQSSSLKQTKSSSSSDAIPAQLIPLRSTARNCELANSSSCCTPSPWIFVFPVSPRISASPALFTSTFTRFAARAISLSRLLSSPVAWGRKRSSCFLNSSSVSMLRLCSYYC